MKIVFDLDGTLSDASERAKKYLIDPPKKDWDGFHAAAVDDPPIPQTLHLFLTLLWAGEDVEIWTGRCESARSDTERWLGRLMDDLPPVNLVMRPIGDHRDDDVLKGEWAEKYGKPDLVFEDRKRVVDMWRSIGVTCYQVAPGDF